jgi:serine/threonine-protein kinase mTOR
MSIVKSHMKNYLEDIFALILKHWNQSSILTQMLQLVEEISQQLKEEFKVFLPDLIPRMLKVLHTDQSSKFQDTRKVLKALESFGSVLEDYLHLTVPAVVDIFEKNNDIDSTKHFLFYFILFLFYFILFDFNF